MFSKVYLVGTEPIESPHFGFDGAPLEPLLSTSSKLGAVVISCGDAGNKVAASLTLVFHQRSVGLDIGLVGILP